MASPVGSSLSADVKNKRRRVSVACLTCRGKHIRCDGVQPICGYCELNGTSCNFAYAENKRRPPSKKFVESLQARIRHLEEQLQAATEARVPSFYEPVWASDESEHEENVSSAEQDEKDPLAELTGLVGRLNMTDDGQVHYFGSQSSYNLVKRSLSDARPALQSLRMQKQGLDAAVRLNRLVTVSKELQEHLLDLYWQWQNPWNYIVHKDSFMKSFRGEDDGRNCSPVLLSCIFALAARYSDAVELRTDPDDPTTAGDAFCEQAKVLLLFESEAPTVTTIQAACLLALRIMSDGKEALGWLYAGNATRMAHNLGLQVDISEVDGKTSMTEEEIEVRRVTWWGCYVVDKLFSIGLGRPSSTSKSTITCAKPQMNGGAEYTPWVPPANATIEESPPMGIHSHISSNACHLSDLMAIACEAMDSIYSPNKRLSIKEIEAIVTKADVELRSRYAALPSYLRIPSSMRSPMLPHVCLLHVQYHSQLILLHRPLLRNRRKRQKSTGGDVSEEAAQQDDEAKNAHMETCRQSAAEITRLLRFYKQQYTLRRIPIAAVHLCFSAAIIHLIDARPSSSNRHQAILHLQTCVEVLRDLRVAWCTWSDRATRAVQVLASEWYGVSDIAQLHARPGPGQGSCDHPQETSWTNYSLDPSHSTTTMCAVPDHFDLGLQGDTSADSFLYYASTPALFIDDMLKEWIDDGVFPFDEQKSG